MHIDSLGVNRILMVGDESTIYKGQLKFLRIIHEYTSAKFYFIKNSTKSS